MQKLVILCISAVLLLPGCVRYDRLLKSEFPQEIELPDLRDITHNFIKTIRVYKEYQTKALFDVLLLSRQTRTAYTECYTAKRGITGEAKDALLLRELEENNHWTTFIVLADIRDKVNAALGDDNAAWTFFMERANGELVRAEQVKEIELDPEYQVMFGHRYALCKTAYLVRFVSVTSDTEVIKLGVSSVYKKAYATWDPATYKTHEDIKLEEDFYWC